MNVTEADAAEIAQKLGKAKRSGKEWSCLCPSHKDTDPSFSVTAEDGELLVRCHRGCDQKTVIAELRSRRLWPEPEKTNGAAGKVTQSRIVATYDYHDANGQMIFQAVRKEPKAFLQRQPDGKGGWIWNLEGVETVLYRLPELIAADPVDYVYIPEGEKDVDRLRSIGLVATTNPMGAGKWRTSFNKWLRNRHVIILPDNDPQDTKPDGTLKFHDDGRPVLVGQDHAAYIASCLRNVAASVRILEIPDLLLKGDVSDWLDAKHTVDELVDLAKAAPVYAPEEANGAATNDNIKRRRQHKTQDGVALEFSARYSDKLRFCHHTEKWFSWDGCIWRREETQLAFDFARTICREFGGKRLARASDAGAVERFARADRTFAVTSEIWDRDTYLLGTPAGTVDLRTGTLRSANIADFISRSTSVTPAEVPECPLWLDFIDKVTCQRTDLSAFLQRWFGYCLTGDTGEHSLLFCYGTGGNGKGVMLNTIATIFGDYAQIAPMDTFTASISDKHPTDLAGLKGARMVLASETEEGRSWDEQRVKSITGGDPISARFMRQDFFTYKPQFKPVIYGNYKGRTPLRRQIPCRTRQRTISPSRT